MSTQKEIRIKTRYTSIEECRESCRDIHKKTVMATTFSRGISGEINQDNHFVLSSTQKGSALFEFVGQIIEADDGIYMVGEIQKKRRALWIIYGNIVFGFLMGLVLIMTMNVVLVFFALFFMSVPWINVIYINRSNALYNVIKKKVS